jgi:hypothetical protein
VQKPTEPINPFFKAAGVVLAVGMFLLGALAMYGFIMAGCAEVREVGKTLSP